MNARRLRGLGQVLVRFASRDDMENSNLENVEPGTELTSEQAKALERVMAETLKAVAKRRKSILLIHDSLQNSIGLFLQLFGWGVEYEVRFVRGEWAPEAMVFDIVAAKGRRELVVEVKDAVAPRDLGQVWGYINALRLSGESAHVYLGTDILNYARLVTGTLGAMIQRLMGEEKMGVILADKYVLVLCHNHAQLTLQEMPDILASEEAVG